MSFSKSHNEVGFSAIEYIVALLIILIAFVCWLELTSKSIRNGNFVKKLPVIDQMCEQKAAELINKTDRSGIALIPQGATSVGSLAPDRPVNGYYDQFNEDGELIPPGNPNATTNGSFLSASEVPVFTRQWKVVKDAPNVGDVTVFVSVIYLGPAGKVMRVAQATDTDFLSEVPTRPRTQINPINLN